MALLNTLTGERPIVIAHRGASGYLPEHTLEAYALAIRQGADFIEPDLVATKDGELIARHEINITDTTDVKDRSKFASRYTTKMIDGAPESGWFADDFTLAEIKTLRATQRVAFRDQSHNGLYSIPTLEEVIDLAKRMSAEVAKTIGIYPETKHPSYHQSRGLAFEQKLVDILHANDLGGREGSVFIQSFEVANLQQLRELTDIRLVQLTGAAGILPDGTLDYNRPYDFVVRDDPRTYGDLHTPAGLAEIASYADAIGPWKRSILSVAGADRDDGDAGKALLAPTRLIGDAHAAGLLVHPYTFRNEPPFLASNYHGDPRLEYQQFLELGVDGVFSDFPDTAVQVLVNK